MNVIVRRTESRGAQCRYCRAKQRWSIEREDRYSADRLCDEHLGLALRNIGLKRLSIEHTATVTAVVRP